MADEPIKMTRAEYQAKYGAIPTPAVDTTPLPEGTTAITIGSQAPVRMTRAEYASKYGALPGESAQWNPYESVTQAGTGTIEGALSTLSLLGDAAGYALPNANTFSQLAKGEFMPVSQKASSLVDALLPAKDPKYRYARTAGNFLGGNLMLPGGATAKGLLSAVTGGVGAQFAEDATKNKTIAPIIGGAIGGAVPGALNSVYKLLRGVTPREIKGSAALALKETTGLTKENLISAIDQRPNDALGSLMTTAEITDNAGMAQLEKTLAASDEPARLYQQRGNARNIVRDQMIDSMSDVKAVNKEGLGTELINQAKDVQGEKLKLAEKIWRKIPRNTSIDVTEQQQGLQSVLDFRQGGLDLNPKVKSLVKQILDPENGGVKTSGALQDIRSDALRLGREANLSVFDERILNTISDGVDSAMESGLKGGDYDLWLKGRAATRNEREIFGRSAAGGSLVAETARPSNVLANAIKGDTKSILEIKAAIKDSPELVEKVKRGFLDAIPRDTQGNLTASGVKRFLNANEGASKALLGKDNHKLLNRIAQDLKSEAKVYDNAYKSSRGGSATAQRTTVAGAVQDVILGSIIPGVGGIARVAEAIKNTANIKNAKQVQDLLFRAAMEPDFALELAKTPTSKRIFSTLDRLKQMTIDSAKSSAIGFGVSRQPQKEESKPQLKVDSSAAMTQAAQEQNLAKDIPLSVETSSSLNSAPISASKQPISYTPKMIKDLIKDEPPIVKAIVKVESNFNHKAKSPKGALGLAQLMPENVKKFGIKDPFDPKESIYGMRTLLSEELDRYKDNPILAIAAYNLGSPKLNKAIDRANSRQWSVVSRYVPTETRDYVRKVLAATRSV